jgi:hypothetical protein
LTVSGLHSPERAADLDKLSPHQSRPPGGERR